MASTLKVNTIQNAAGSNTISDGSPSIDLWRLSANFSNNATITGWERPDETSATNASHVNGLTESSGVFTFPSTGYFLIQLCAQVEAASNADGTIGVQIETSVDGGSSFTLAGFSSSGDTDTGNSNGSNTQIMFKVTDTSQARIRFVASSLSAGTFVHGSSTFNLTNFSSVKVAPIQ